MDESTYVGPTAAAKLAALAKAELGKKAGKDVALSLIHIYSEQRSMKW